MVHCKRRLSPLEHRRERKKGACSAMTSPVLSSPTALRVAVQRLTPAVQRAATLRLPENRVLSTLRSRRGAVGACSCVKRAEAASWILRLTLPPPPSFLPALKRTGSSRRAAQCVRQTMSRVQVLLLIVLCSSAAAKFNTQLDAKHKGGTDCQDQRLCCHSK